MNISSSCVTESGEDLRGCTSVETAAEMPAATPLAPAPAASRPASPRRNLSHLPTYVPGNYRSAPGGHAPDCWRHAEGRDTLHLLACGTRRATASSENWRSAGEPPPRFAAFATTCGRSPSPAPPDPRRAILPMTSTVRSMRFHALQALSDAVHQGRDALYHWPALSSTGPTFSTTGSILVASPRPFRRSVPSSPASFEPICRRRAPQGLHQESDASQPDGAVITSRKTSSDMRVLLRLLVVFTVSR